MAGMMTAVNAIFSAGLNLEFACFATASKALYIDQRSPNPPDQLI
jgi:hypothetical protein